jgi:predicted Zn-dependent protease
LERHPDHALALRTRGQFALADQKPSEAEGWLRRAAAVAPDDYQSQWLFYQSLQQQNKPEAKAQLQLADEVKERAERLGDLQTRRLYEQPLNPALHYELGVMLLRGGHKSVGESWLLSALNLDPNYRPAHAALAEYYAEQGDATRAEEHRRKSEMK